ncbi:MAG: DUF2513 domain-containing protein [Hydrogenophaga sp.]|uniref:DUF2513 domain-containing protein n=1 Tax=Hydrogenophaga sp. TaxID=1904254 RepID=UPI002ABBA66D|nr:DUF2513 domain-containing protein [Hydrogenophaga sp.]MDZ4104380.1 DUF2513 domain-containing protein [Hydrogenophaga sp.]
MKRDWDLIREVLIEIEALEEPKRYMVTYGVGDEHQPEAHAKAHQALLLWKAGFIEAVDASSLAGPAIVSPALTWQGHDLLDTLRSKPVWERIKKIAEEKGIELTFDAVKALGKAALSAVAGG